MNAVPDRARKRAVRAYSREAGVAYSEAARRLYPVAFARGERLASHGRTVYPPSNDTHRHRLVADRDRRPAADRIRDARRAADLPTGRAHHLAERFPPTRGEPGTGVGPLYHGEGREDTLALLYATAAHEAPGLVPSIGDLAWEAEMGEETAVDLACADLDRASRRLLDHDRPALLRRIETALEAGAGGRANARLAAAAAAALTVRDGPDGQPVVAGLPLDGVRHILDALLIVADDGHAAGTRVRIFAGPHRGRSGTIVGAHWGPSGPPLRYDVQPDGRAPVAVEPNDLVVLANG
jgi:hypothetical protein